MSLFAGSMLILVVSDNLLTLFVGWELMGLCSYLLIGFWYAKTYDDPKATTTSNGSGQSLYDHSVLAMSSCCWALSFSTVSLGR